MNAREALVESVRVIGWNLSEKHMWTHLRIGVNAGVALILRIAILVAFPVTVPVIAWLLIKEERDRPAREAEARTRLRAGIHRNGR